jgi:hypothetical protein
MGLNAEGLMGHKINDVVRIKGLLKPDDTWNDTLCIVISEAYIHPEARTLVIRVKIYETLWAVEPGNLEKVTEAERLAYFRGYDGNRIVEWSKCLWQPDPNFRRDGFSI